MRLRILLLNRIKITNSKLHYRFYFSIAPKAQGRKTTITSSDRAAVFLELADAHMEAGQLVNQDYLMLTPILSLVIVFVHS